MEAVRSRGTAENRLDGLEFDYTVDGETASSEVDLTWVQCPKGSRIGIKRPCVRLNRTGS